jgi:tetratricopeptide (TPR) repeat protein
VKREKPAQRIFISHAHANIRVARKIHTALQDAGQQPWLDDSDIHIGVLLRKELQQAIAGSKAVVLVWSEAAAKSRWVAAEILTSFHLDRFIVPCTVDDTALPQFLSRSIFINLQRSRDRALAKLGEQLKAAAGGRNEFPAAVPFQSAELQQTIYRLNAKQHEVATAPDTETALRLQKALDPEMRAAEKRWRFDSTILNLAGYHRKNAYMYKHWDEYCAGRFPSDPLLTRAEWFFYKTVFANPLDFSALNGLGNILLFEGEHEAALFFVERAIELAKKAGIDYADAKSDRQLILTRMGRSPSGKATYA